MKVIEMNLTVELTLDQVVGIVQQMPPEEKQAAASRAHECRVPKWSFGSYARHEGRIGTQ